MAHGAEEEAAENLGLAEAFGQFRNRDLLMALGGLQLLEANHPHRLRLEYAANLASSIPCLGTGEVTPATLVSILREHLPLTGLLGQGQDRPENLFTENIILQGRNYIVSPGIVDNGAFMLQELLDALSVDQGEALATLRGKLLPAIKALLTVTDECAKRMGYARNRDDPDRWLPDIGFSDANDVATAASACWFSHDDLVNLLSAWGLTPTDLAPFVLVSKVRDFEAVDPLQSPLDACPLRSSEDGLVLAIPGAVTAALRHFVWSKAIRASLVTDLAASRQRRAGARVKSDLSWLGFEPIAVKLPAWNSPPQVEEAIFRFDVDKLAHVLVASDDGNGYDPTNLYASAWLPAFATELGERHTQATEFLTGSGVHDCTSVFAITVMCSIGRMSGLGYDAGHDRMRSLLLGSAELSVLAGLKGECDSLVLWKFAGAAVAGPHIGLCSILDTFALYRRHRDSFYTSDDYRPTDVFIEPGYGRDIRTSVVKIWDTHLAPQGVPPVGVRVCRASDDQKVPIYIPMPHQIADAALTRLVLGYSQAVWVSARPADAKDMAQAHRMLYDVAGVIARWLMVFQAQLSPHLDPLGPYPIELEMRLEQAAAWASGARQPKPVDEMELSFPIELAPAKASVTIPIEVQDIACRPDNSADRVLASAILAGLGALIEAVSGTNTLCEEERERIVDACLPLGVGKSLMVFSGARDTGLYSFDKQPLRLVQESDVQAVADEIAGRAGEGIPVTSTALPPENRKWLCKKAVEAATDAMRRLATKMDGQMLLEWLIGNYEAVLHERAVLKVTRPTRTALAADPAAEMREIRSNVELLDRTALATRTLIEFVAAEPPVGDGRPSLEDLDRLMAYGNHIVYWGLVDEGVHLGLFDTGLRVLASGRIGRKDDVAYIRLATEYMAAKTAERIQDDTARFAKWFEPISRGLPSEAPPELDKAFGAEFGIAPVEFRKLVNALGQISAQNNRSVMRLARTTLTHLLLESTGGAPSVTDVFLKRFALRARARWDLSPLGFQKHDWYPWRYNGQLAYEGRFLVVSAHAGADETVYWGIRHLMNAADHLAHLISIGRYDARSQEMLALEGGIRQRLGNDFESQVAKWFTTNAGWRVEPNVHVGPGGALHACEDLGDIDVLTWDPKSGALFSLECKDIVTSRSPREMYRELSYFIGSTGNKNSYVAKHSRRHEWLERNLEVAASWMKLPRTPAAVVSAFVTSEEVPTAYLRDVPLKVVSLPTLKRSGVRILFQQEPTPSNQTGQCDDQES